MREDIVRTAPWMVYYKTTGELYKEARRRSVKSEVQWSCRVAYERCGICWWIIDIQAGTTHNTTSCRRARESTSCSSTFLSCRAGVCPTVRLGENDRSTDQPTDRQNDRLIKIITKITCKMSPNEKLLGWYLRLQPSWSVTAMGRKK